MTDKIEFIDIDGKNYKLELFPANVQQLVTTYEIVRSQYNDSAVTTAALNDYMNRVASEVQTVAKAALDDMLRPAPVATEEVAAVDAEGK